jgi:hypothetical protein
MEHIHHSYNCIQLITQTTSLCPHSYKVDKPSTRGLKYFYHHRDQPNNRTLTLPLPSYSRSIAVITFSDRANNELIIGSPISSPKGKNIVSDHFYGVLSSQHGLLSMVHDIFFSSSTLIPHIHFQLPFDYK